MAKRMNLGDILMHQGVIDEHQLRSALAHQRQWGTRLGRALVEKRFCSLEALMEALSQQTGLPRIDLGSHILDASLAPLLPSKVAQKYRVIPLRVEGKRQEVLVVAIAAPATLEALDAVRSASGKQRVLAYLADDDSIERAIGLIYLGYAAAETRPVAPISAAEGHHGIEFDLGSIATAPRRPRPVLLYGWTEESGKAVALTLAAAGIDAKVVGALEVLGCRERDVVLAPLHVLETLHRAGNQLKGALVVACKAPETDLPRAQRLGAKGYVSAPLDYEHVIRVVRRCLGSSAPQAAA